jgi:hypothetical protein
LRQALNHRLPITELIVIAAMLDPSQRHLNSVQEFLTAQKISAVGLLSHAFDKYVGTETELGLHQAGQHMASVENPGPSTPVGPVPWKKAKQDLLSKHVNATSNPDREIQQYRCLSIAPDDVLAWWCT